MKTKYSFPQVFFSLDYIQGMVRGIRELNEGNLSAYDEQYILDSNIDRAKNIIRLMQDYLSFFE